jgi:hypothetical protein
MNYAQIEKNVEINAELENYEITIFELQNLITAEKQKKNTNLSVLGQLRDKLNKAHEKYCDLYLLKYEI